ncbi:TPA: ATP-binding protein [Vibrio vulnificus]|nr:ATP-binding protein [Vibrio vulnificus]HDY8012859.1 ATP-binding protein [Vibrio vulnificus]
MIKQKGTFSIEFAIISVVLVAVLTLAIHAAIGMQMRGQLDRLSYSLSSILRERTQLYGKNDFNIDQTEANQLYFIALNSLKRSNSNFDANKLTMTIESLRFDNQNTPILQTQAVHGGCHVKSPLANKSDLSMSTPWGRRATLYQVTLCYSLDGPTIANTSTLIASSSVNIGR